MPPSVRQADGRKSHGPAGRNLRCRLCPDARRPCPAPPTPAPAA
ncbi:hypothetical protein APX70_200332 [Pseudomonas syringae pv. maculicola]|uniref:Uncharacterized protein n=1 Tax=Pseudomonas syringae pv. maculicola TaxID=59511 RepID=A0A3M2WVV1_PSEYM|nr:hypothetical protein APX70_200332 [Pseudomonas syringae pv. maculicola]